jgi:pyruvate formate lyase activating enzyme
MKTLRLFDIEKFATKDGPGIRTVVFFKGCPLQCLWCHNPEGISRDIELSFDKDKCLGCKLCIDPLAALANKELDKAKICPTKALKLEGFDMEVEEVLSILLEDAAYYRNSKGGITLSGGEVLCQADGAAKLLARCKEENLHCAIETSLYAQPSEIEKLLPYLDYILFDIKCMSASLHKELTGCDNTLILENARFIAKSKIPFSVRTPVIVGLQDNEIAEIVRFVSTLGPEYYELLTYNPFGVCKAEKLGKSQSTYTAPTLQQMKQFAGIAKAYGLAVRIDGESQ